MTFPLRLLPESECSPSPSMRILHINLTDRAYIQAHYMPFLTNKGLFHPTEELSPPGTRVSLILGFLNEPGKKTITGAVRWITPLSAHMGNQSGIGIEFDQNQSAKELTAKIDLILAGRPEIRTKTI